MKRYEECINCFWFQWGVHDKVKRCTLDESITGKDNASNIKILRCSKFINKDKCYGSKKYN